MFISSYIYTYTYVYLTLVSTSPLFLPLSYFYLTLISTSLSLFLYNDMNDDYTDIQPNKQTILDL